MIRYLTLAIMVFSASEALAQSPDCDNAMTQSDMNICAGRDYARADAELNRIYKQVREALKPDAKATQLLITAQRQWIAFRDATCALEAYPNTGGSLYGMVLTTCKTGLTDARTKDLTAILER
ncbi:lysozyme inhibitor LprI family protein [Asticcacaulis sp. ZE23SCel15]|uniref:lysozyme inhibitor LprI family protein n=1 Tax=Asticcacaulis sp. ZE23SCel15 TaxID=3059027 RepID=UPI00265E9A2C|nr:lysozyme inhibitor LprI family protein [Asticcacaulis sp. ZE23SCel15]WKL58388.1 lysozyme inhibitor LprI family protein [Asticcacaulis sp. ZE23SCel15]